jgi:hypothetical protein
MKKEPNSPLKMEGAAGDFRRQGRCEIRDFYEESEENL